MVSPLLLLQLTPLTEHGSWFGRPVSAWTGLPVPTGCDGSSSTSRSSPVTSGIRLATPPEEPPLDELLLAEPLDELLDELEELLPDDDEDEEELWPPELDEDELLEELDEELPPELELPELEEMPPELEEMPPELLLLLPELLLLLSQPSSISDEAATSASRALFNA